MDNISTRKLSKKLKKINKKDKPFKKDKFIFDHEKKHLYLPNGSNTRKPKKATKRTHESHTGQKTAKTCKKHQECCGNNYSRVITDYENPNKIKMLRKMETP